ncbi:hypothetical protein [Thermaerobacillus caldiproteolyticus]|uniref:Uncharacterized protein n=1 Tax=Thermaerobacillus caldiproteolyticus TaxID=247480 RepID=A0A7V9Z8X8_9BACL|nr:hypothetical protein [Anoxybacillus caldiproteolyticus]MBA2876242.1 hypothetical protein [Anoxybacillus caldiproteolyticus]
MVQDDYKELDMLEYGIDDDALNMFLPFYIIDIVKCEEMDIVTVLIGADNPQDLLTDDVREFAKNKAEFKLNAASNLINESDVIVNGQNELPFKLFTFQKNK